MQVYRIKNENEFKVAVPNKIDISAKDKLAIGIVRVSSLGQKDNNSESFQTNEIREYAIRKNLKLNYLFCIVESAKSSEDRKVFNCIDQWATKHQIKHRIFYKPDREARNLTDIEQMIVRVRKKEIVVHYALENTSFDHKILPSDILMRNMRAVFDSHYSTDLGHKIEAGQKAKAESGHFPGCNTPLGYEHRRTKSKSGFDKARGTYLAQSSNPKEVEQVQREFFHRGINGLSYEAIREKIIEEGFIHEDEIHKYRASSIERRLKNKLYRGLFDWCGVEYKGVHELIIPQDIVAKVQLTQGLRGQYKKETKGIFPNGWLKCADVGCGCHIVCDPKTKLIKSTGETKTYNYYHCTNGKGIHSSLRGMNVSETKIWEQLEGAVDAITIEEDWAKQLMTALNESRVKLQKAIKGDIENYKHALGLLREKENRAYDRYDSGEIDKNTYNDQRKRIHDEQINVTNLMEQALYCTHKKG